MYNKRLIVEQLIKEEIAISEKHLKKACEIYLNAIADFLKLNPDLKEFEIYVNNHEFNDGDETTFSVSLRSPELTFVSEPETQEEIAKANQIETDLIELLACAQNSPMLEKIFGGYHEYTTINLEVLENWFSNE